MEPEAELSEITRRHFLARSGAAVIGTVGFAMLLADEGYAQVQKPRTDPFAPRPSHFPGKAKRVIFLNMTGAPSQPRRWAIAARTSGSSDQSVTS